ncbi:hypothetical protein [Streptomyces tendae]
MTGSRRGAALPRVDESLYIVEAAATCEPGVDRRGGPRQGAREK